MAAKNRSSRSSRASGVVAKPLKITKRIVNSKRHTIGYIVGSKTYSLESAVQRKTLLSMGRQGRLSGVRVVGNHLQAVPGRKKLSTLPTEINRS